MSSKPLFSTHCGWGGGQIWPKLLSNPGAWNHAPPQNWPPVNVRLLTKDDTTLFKGSLLIGVHYTAWHIVHLWIGAGKDYGHPIKHFFIKIPTWLGLKFGQKNFGAFGKVVLVLPKVAWADSCVVIAIITQGSAHATLRSTRTTLAFGVFSVNLSVPF